MTLQIHQTSSCNEYTWDWSSITYWEVIWPFFTVSILDIHLLCSVFKIIVGFLLFSHKYCVLGLMKLLLYTLYRIFIFVMNELCQISNLPLTGVNKVLLIQFLCFLCELSMLTFQLFSDLDDGNAVKKRINEILNLVDDVDTSPQCPRLYG